MLWQPSLPDAYTKMPAEELAAAIRARKAELGDQLVILGHHYQTDEIIQHADYTGDSLKLSQIAAKLAAERPANRPVRYVIFCGVHFMAESADMLTPDEVAVILPDLSAGCSMADMAAYDDTVDAWNSIHASLHAKGWKGRVIPITYVNSTAAIKAFVGEHGGACCTSSNASEVFKWAMSRGATNEDVKILFLPDQHLGRNTAAKYGVDVSTQTCLYDPKLARKGQELGGSTHEQVHRARVILWAGHCSVHKLFRPEHCDAIRAENAANADVEPTKILVHPECAKEVVDKSDLNGSTEFIINTIRNARPGSRWAIGTEVHLVNRLANEAKARGVFVRILSDCQCLCTTMYRIDQPHLLWNLDNLLGKFDGRDVGASGGGGGVGAGKEGRARVVNQISVPAEVREQALKALDRMLELSPPSAVPTRLAEVD
jgi:quinolinate synthase